jgi:hypothetical protein
VDKEKLIEFNILCESNAESAEIGKLFRVLKSNGIVVHFNSELLKCSDKSEYLQVTFFNFSQQLMQKYHDFMKIKKLETKDIKKPS